MRIPSRFLTPIFLWMLGLTLLRAEPTEIREWVASSGHTLEGRALQIAEGKVQFERKDGSKITVDLGKLADEDQTFLREHFGIEEKSAASGAGGPPVSDPPDDLPYALGELVEDVQAEDDWSYMLYLPKSLRKGEKHPVIFLMDPGGGNVKAVNRYIQGAERNGWIIAHSKQSKNGFGESQEAIDAMIEHVTDELPIDEDRMYTSGFSGGSRMAFTTSENHKKIAGVIPCGAGGDVGSKKQTVYGVCGTNCYNRTDMANSFKGMSNKDNVLRYFPGKHSWANEELFDDAITHLNGVFLIANRKDYPLAYEHYLHAVVSLIEENAEKNPLRAAMWADFLSSRGVEHPGLAALQDKLKGDSLNELYLKGLTEVGEFAQSVFGDISTSSWEIREKDAAAFKEESAKYEGTPWAEILMLMSEDAAKP